MMKWNAAKPLLLMLFFTHSALSFRSLTFLSKRPVSGTRIALSASMLEVEQKFVLSDGSAVETKLRDLGLAKKEEISMVDWYFDLTIPTLTPRDNWLRYRESGGKGLWQLKKGQRHQNGATVYEEVEGTKAIDETLAMLANEPLRDTSAAVVTEHKGYQVPLLPDQTCGLVPFARIETQRTSWASGELTVDLDGTNTGYMVGEVEIVVGDKDEVAAARQKIAAFLERLDLPTHNDGPAVGKLEDYLFKHRPDHYQACVEGGSIDDKR